MYSMTGYGRAEKITEHYEVQVELRSVNHRYLETNIRVPRNYGYLEEKMKSQIKTCISRGKIEVYVSLQLLPGIGEEVKVNHERILSYVQALQQETNRLNQEENVPVTYDLSTSDLLRLPEAFTLSKEAEDADNVWAEIQPVAEEAIANFTHMREIEGKKLADDILFRLENLEKMVCQVEELVPQTVQAYYDRILARLQELLDGNEIDHSRLVTEAGIVAEKIAVDEETVRLHSHIEQFRKLVESTEPVGRKMDFLVQEMNREVNTTGSKSQMLEITRLVVDMKSEIEKIREQIQNIE